MYFFYTKVAVLYCSLTLSLSWAIQHDKLNVGLFSNRKALHVIGGIYHSTDDILHSTDDDDILYSTDDIPPLY